MTLEQLSGPPGPELARALAEFEAGFTYPLGPDRFFRIEHGDDYPCFFRAIGEAACFVAVADGTVLGTLGVAIRRLLLPAGGERRVAYVGDLKLAAHARGGITLLRLTRAAQAWATPRVQAAFGVVMDGTRVTPETYTGRAGIPAFRELGKLAVLRLPASREQRDADGRFLTAPGPAQACYGSLSRGRYASLGGTPSERSEHALSWLMHPDGLACGQLEDTRKAKRLIADDGSEMRSAHLAHFAFRTERAGADLLGVALRRCGQWDIPALFVSVAAAEADGLRQALGDTRAVTAPATVYGSGLLPGPAWNINTSEI
jgi:hypothetical protein